MIRTSVDTTGPIVITIEMEDVQDKGVLSNLTQSAINSALYEATNRIKQAALEVVPFRTGELYDSMLISFTSTGLNIRFTADYARIVEMGAPEHIIKPEGDHPLAFWWPRGPQGPKTYYFEKVEHPGYSGRGFLAKLRQIAVNIVKEEIARALYAYTGGA